MKDLKHIIWDWNGTLLDDAVTTHRVLNELFQSRGIPTISLETFLALSRVPIRAFYEDLGIDLVKHNLGEMAEEFYRGYSVAVRSCSLHPAVRTVLEEMRVAGYSQSILSAHNQAGLEADVAQFELAHHFTDLVGALDKSANGKVGRGQQWFAQQPHLAPSQVIIIGDTTHDAEVAHALGIHCVLVASGAQSRAVLDRTGLTVLGSLAELPGLLRERRG